MPAMHWFGQVERQAAELKIVADEDRTGHGLHDHHHVALLPEEVAEGIAAAIEAQAIAQLMDEPAGLDGNRPDLNRLLLRLRFCPGQQVLAEKEYEKDQESQSIQAPEEFAAKYHGQRHAGNRPDAPGGRTKLPSPGAVVQERRLVSGEW